MNDTTGFFSGKRIAVTGAAGTVGKEIVRQLLALDADEVRMLDNNEGELFYFSESLKYERRARPFMIDIQDKEMLMTMFRQIDIVIHSAAYKNVPVCEASPYSAVCVNINGTQNVITAASERHVKYVLFTSSDKAVNPTNVMGTTKLMGERLVTAANVFSEGASDTVFCSTRFGNVTGSRGSVLPVFESQIAKGGPITLTDRSMTRFMMSLKEATELVLKSLTYSNGGEVFVTKMPVFNIGDLAEVLIERLAPAYGYKPSEIQIDLIGARAGEKMFEELTTEEEIARCHDLGEMLAVLPAFSNVYSFIDHSEYKNLPNIDRVYNSSKEKKVSKDEIHNFLSAIYGSV